VPQALQELFAAISEHSTMLVLPANPESRLAAAVGVNHRLKKLLGLLAENATGHDMAS
jgi:hypothetical protein